MNWRPMATNINVQEFQYFYSPLKRGDKGVCKFSATHPQPLFLEGSLKVAVKGSLILINNNRIASVNL